MAFYYGGGRRALPSIVYSRPGSAQMGLLSDELWPVPQFVSTGAGDYGRRRKSEPKDELDEADHNPADVDNSDEPTGLPARVINQYRERLDQEGLDYLARGPRTFEEQLAYAQWVRPSAHHNSRAAPPEDQLRFRQWRNVDWANNFVGPDGIVYVRDHVVGEEKPEARIFRAYENMVGGFKRPKLDDLLGQFDLPDPREGYSPETKAKVAEVEAPISADEAAWRAWARAQHVSPVTWFMGEQLPESYQYDYRVGLTRDVPPVVFGSAFIGPDGYIYHRTKLSDPDRATQASQAFEEKWAKESLRDTPLSAQELYDRALGSGAFLPGSNPGRGYFPRTTYSQASTPRVTGQTWQTPTVQEIVRLARRWGRLGSPRTRALNEWLARLGESDFWKHTGGARNAKGKRLKETYIPSPLKDFGIDGRKGSNFVDVTHTGKDGKVTYTQSMTVDPKTRKAAIEELDTLLKIRNRMGGSVIGVLKFPPEKED
jgi:hypothetical protein